jgi:hypothetical protein
MHKDHLCAASMYFKLALEGKFQEAALGEVTLNEINIGPFGVFNEWLYTGKITEVVYEEKRLTREEMYIKDRPSFSQLLEVWHLADYLLAPKLQNYITDMMMDKYKRRLVAPFADFSYVYKTTQKGSLMRKFMVDLCVWRMRGQGENIYRQRIDYIPREMAVDLLIALTQRVESRLQDPWTVAGHYHVPEKVQSVKNSTIP